MKIIDKYIFKEMLSPFIFGIGIFTFALLSNQIIRMIEMILNKGVDVTTALLVFVYIIPSFLVLVIPSTVLLSSLIGFSRLASDSETTALTAAGVSLYRMLAPVLLFSFLAWMLTGYLMIFEVPRSNHSFKRLLRRLVKSNALLDIKEKTFYDGIKGMILYADEISESGGPMRGVLISDFRHGPEPALIVAREGVFGSNPDGLKLGFQLKDGSIHNPLGDEFYRKVDFEEFNIQIDVGKLLNKKKSKRNREMTIRELRDKIAQKKKEKENFYPQLVELHKKFSLPFVAFIIPLVGAPLGFRSRFRSGHRSAGVMLCIVIVFLFYVLLRAGETMGGKGTIAPWLGMWGPNFLLLTLGGYLTYMIGEQKRLIWVESFFDFFERIYLRLKYIIYKR